jgi:hypothetical protein
MKRVRAKKDCIYSKAHGKVCTHGICSASFEPEILQGSFLTSISVIVIHTLFIVCPVPRSNGFIL